MSHLRLPRPLIAVAVLLLAALVVALHGGGGARAPALTDGGAAVAGPPSPAGAFPAYVRRVVDGDTVIATRAGSGRLLRVRLIGVDTPESVRPGTPVRCFAHEASAYTAALLTHRWVRAAYEPGGRHDRYGRELWDVWLPRDRFVAALLAAGGYARAYPYPPQTRYAGLLRRLADRARAAGRGLWGPPCHGDSFG